MDLGIGSEVTIDISTNTQPLKLNVTMTGSVYGYTEQNSQRGMYTGYNMHPYESFRNELVNEFEIDIGTNTFFQDLESQIASWVKKEFGHVRPSKLPLIITLMVAGSEPVTCCSVHSSSTESSIIITPFVLSTSHRYTRLEVSNSRSLTRTTCVPIDMDAGTGYRYNVINGYTTLSDLYEAYDRSDGAKPAAFYFYKSPRDFSKRAHANWFNWMRVGLDIADVRVWIPREYNIVFPHESKARPKNRRCEIM